MKTAVGIVGFGLIEVGIALFSACMASGSTLAIDMLLWFAVFEFSCNVVLGLLAWMLVQD